MTHVAEATTGTATDGSLSVTVDPTMRVVAVEVHTVEPLRQPAQLDLAVGSAFTAAVAAQIPDDPAEEGTEIPKPRRVVLTVGRPTQEMLQRHQVRVQQHLEPRTTAAGPRTGSSQNECVTVTLPPTGGRGRLEVDPGWLSQTSGARLGTAITEAYDAAYSRRES